MNLLLNYFESYQKATPFLFAALGFSFVIIVLTIGKPLSKNWSLMHSLQEKKERSERAPQRIQALQLELASITESEIRPYESEAILSSISKYCNAHNLRIESLPNAKFMVQDDMTLVSQAIELEGSYKDLLGMLYVLERKEKLGVINSAHFYKVKNRKAKMEKLRLQFVLRNIII